MQVRVSALGLGLVAVRCDVRVAVGSCVGTGAFSAVCCVCVCVKLIAGGF